MLRGYIYDLIPATPAYAGIDAGYFNYFAARQNNSNWCWAACIQMILNYYGLSVKQEDLARNHCGVDYFGRAGNCRASNEIITRNLNLCISDAATGQKICLHANVNLHRPSANDLLWAMQEKRPVLLAYQNEQGSGHAVVITGVSYRDTFLGLQNGLNSIVVRDPAQTYPRQVNPGRIEYNPVYLLERVYAWWVPVLTEVDNYRRGWL